MEQNATAINNDIINRFNNGCEHFENAFIARKALNDAKRKSENRECANEIFGALELFLKDYINGKNSNQRNSIGRFLLTPQEKADLNYGGYTFHKLVNELISKYNETLKLPLPTLNRLIELKSIRNSSEHKGYEPEFEELKESLMLIYKIFKDFHALPNLKNANELINSLLSDSWLVNKITDVSMESINSKIDSIKDYLNSDIDKETKEKYETQINQLEQQKANLEAELHTVHEQISKIDISTASELFKQAYQFYCNGDIDKALEVLDEKTLRENELWDAQNRLLKAFLLRLLNKPEESHQSFYKAFQIQPQEMQSWLPFFPNTTSNPIDVVNPITQPLGVGTVLPSGIMYPPNHQNQLIDINKIGQQLAQQILDTLLGKVSPQPKQADNHITDDLRLMVMRLQEKILQLEDLISTRDVLPTIKEKPTKTAKLIQREVEQVPPKTEKKEKSQISEENHEDVLKWWSNLEEQWQSVFSMKFDIDKKSPDREKLRGVINTDHFIFQGSRSPFLSMPISLTNISGILGLKNIKTLDLSYHKIENLSGIEHLSNLKTITMHMNDLKTVKGVEDLPNLIKLEIPLNHDIPDQEIIDLQKKKPDLTIICEQKKEKFEDKDIREDPRWKANMDFFNSISS